MFGLIEMPFHDICQRSLNPLDVASGERFPWKIIPSAPVQSWYQDLPEDRLNALRSFTGRRISPDGRPVESSRCAQAVDADRRPAGDRNHEDLADAGAFHGCR